MNVYLIPCPRVPAEKVDGPRSVIHAASWDREDGGLEGLSPMRSQKWMRFSRRAAEARRLAALRKDSSAAEETMICKVPGQHMEYAHPPLASV